ncbi:phage tail protein [Photorhabdus sp. HUG-39]|uniref:Phage tail protein n=1 Tax=Photorhabdus kayaii TaxID=230088 RepID=A0ABX0B599_9GAMM|nr:MULTISPECIES: phage tail tube protein [Photorhabdus]MCC8375782.1 phage tail protein [Photorhabdus bodei]NDL14347.1 phage tail protein [Photorhabdus kayaii]NDL27864.1 phage tail protein [Photorhabdus kayaii]RAX06529.1 phage tail protein [Photorhabdus sp. HUG-39]
MAFNIPNGSKVYISNKLGEAANITAATNDKEVVLTVDNLNDIKAGDIVQIDSGWSKMKGAFRVKVASGTSVTLEGMDTTDKDNFPAGGAVGTIRKVIAFTRIEQVLTVSIEGGDQQSTTVQFLEDDQAQNVDTFKNAVVMTFNFAYDPTLPAHSLLIGMDESKELVTVYFFNKKAGHDRYFNATVSYQEIPKTAINEVENIDVKFSLRSKQMIYVRGSAKK